MPAPDSILPARLAAIRQQATVVQSDPIRLDVLLDTRDTAALVGKSESTLNRWRCQGNSPIPYIRQRGSVRYALADVLSYLSTCRVASRQP